MKKITKALKNLGSAIASTGKEVAQEARTTLADGVESFVNNNKSLKGHKMIEIIEKVPFKNENEIVVLEKGANLTVAAETTKVGCGIEWDEVTTGVDFDADVSCLLVKEDTSKNELIYYGTNKVNGEIASSCGSVLHTGDNLTGADDAVEGVAVNEDDETIYVDLAKLPADVKKVVFFVNIYGAENKKQNFGTTGTMGARLYDGATAHIFMEADLMEDNATQTSMIIGEFYRKDAGFKYKNMAQGGKQTLTEFANSYK